VQFFTERMNWNTGYINLLLMKFEVIMVVNIKNMDLV